MGVSVRVEDGMLLALNVNEGVASHGMQVAYREQERRGPDSLLSSQKEPVLPTH